MLHIQSQLSYSFITRHFSHYKSSCGVTCKKKSDKLRHKSSSSDKNCTVHSVSLIDQEQKRMATDSRKSWNKWRKKKKKKRDKPKNKTITTNCPTVRRYLYANSWNNSGNVQNAIVMKVNDVLCSAQFTDINLTRDIQFVHLKPALQLYYHSSATGNMVQDYNK